MITRPAKWVDEYLPLTELLNIQRIVTIIEELGKMTDTPRKGVTRLAYSERHLEAKQYISKLMVDAGLSVETSPIGNTFGRLCPDGCEQPAILTGSHVDTVVNGGKFDGVVGVACAIEVLRVLKRIQSQLIYPIEVVDFVMEESARFGGGYGFGSFTMLGGKVDHSFLQRRDNENIALSDAIQNVAELRYYRHVKGDGYSSNVERALAQIEQSYRSPSEIKAFVELHVEQGQVLEETGIPIGIVTDTATPTRLKIDLIGQQNHSGTTPMHMRRNALCAASEITLALDELCLEEVAKGEQTVGAITRLIVEPNVMNTIPGRSLMWLDLRSTNQTSKNRVLKQLSLMMKKIVANRGVTLSTETLVDEEPVAFSPKLARIIARSCDMEGIHFTHMPSGAGHDACHVARAVNDVSMIFIPSQGGISHHPNEFTEPDDILRGAKVLLLSLLQLAMEL